MNSPNPTHPWTTDRVADIIHADLETRWHGSPFGPVTTDSRTLRPGNVFLALRGETFDGHRFCAQAAADGASALIVDRHFDRDALDADLPVFVVEDALRAYGDLAAQRRQEWGGPLLAISGSAGKTTTRRMVVAALSRHRRVLEPLKNYNNLIGVPHTLLRLTGDHQTAVLELGMNQPGELARLTEIARPDAALMTMIGMTHIGMFASQAELTSAKLDLFRGCADGVPLVVNARCENTLAEIESFAKRHPIIRFDGSFNRAGHPAVAAVADVVIDAIEPLRPVGYRFDLLVRGQRLPGMELRLFGRHQIQNVAAAAGLLLAAGLEPDALGKALADTLADFASEPLRGEFVVRDGVEMILDCYNASPAGMRGALASLADVPVSGRRILVLADMLELGDHSTVAHQALLGPLRQLAPAQLLGLGPQCTALAQTLAAEGWTARGFEDRDQLAEELRGDIRRGDQLFFKGSHGFGLERVAETLAPGLLDELR